IHDFDTLETKNNSEIPIGHFKREEDFIFEKVCQRIIDRCKKDLQKAFLGETIEIRKFDASLQDQSYCFDLTVSPIWMGDKIIRLLCLANNVTSESERKEPGHIFQVGKDSILENGK